MPYKKNTNNKGFTLVEVVIYSALLTVLMTGVISLALSITGIYVKSRGMEEVLYGARQVERVLTYYMKEQAIDTISPMPNQESNSLAMALPDNSRVDFYLDNGRLMMRIDSQEPLAISQNEIVIEGLGIRNISNGNDRDSINIACKIRMDHAESMEFRYEFDFNMTVNTES